MANNKDLNTTSSLEGLQSNEQRLVLDTVAQVRKCGLESILSLPQLVVCGDQSAGKSSVLEALTEIPFPRADNLCTRFATEIILRRAPSESLTVKVIPDTTRSNTEQDSIRAFQQTIIDFSELPDLMARAMKVMGIDLDGNVAPPRAFARDVLSIKIEGPTRPQLTLVDLPGLIQNETKGVTKADVELVKELTEHYISQPRTICLAVIAATNDYANQGILSKVQNADPEGERSIGIITKPDRLPPGSGSEKAFISLARNEDIFFKLGWHVLKNRSFEEGESSFEARNDSEAKYFRTSNFSTLPTDCTGIEALRDRLSLVLFEHIKRELPKLREDVEKALAETRRDLSSLGQSRATKSDLQMCHLDSHAEEPFSTLSTAAIRRLRALVQAMNVEFSNGFRQKGHTYRFLDENEPEASTETPKTIAGHNLPITMSHAQALEWVSQTIIKNPGKELLGSYNPLLIGELFWKQSIQWRSLAEDHLKQVFTVCTKFLEDLLKHNCHQAIYSRLWRTMFQDGLKERYSAAIRELDLIMKDMKGHPINYNHYFTDTVKKLREARERKSLKRSIGEATVRHGTVNKLDVDTAFTNFAQRIDPDMTNVGCEEALDALRAIYKVMQKTFIANITTQVIERHIVAGLETIFSPVTVNRLSDEEAEALVSESAAAKRQRTFYANRLAKLQEGQKILRNVMGSAAV